MIQKIFCPVRIKGGFASQSILGAHYMSQHEKAPFFRLFAEGAYAAEGGVQAVVRYFNLPPLSLPISQVGIDIRKNDIFYNAVDASYAVASASVESPMAFAKGQAGYQGASKPPILGSHYWLPAWQAAKDLKLMAFYSSIYELYLSNLASQASQADISATAGLIGPEQAENAVRQLNMGSSEFASFLFESGLGY